MISTKKFSEDFNAKNTQWGYRLTSTKGKQLLSAIQSSNLKYFSTDEPTYWPSDINKLPDLIDFFVTKGTWPDYLSCHSSFDPSLNHSSIIACLNSDIKPVNQNCYSSTKLNNRLETVRI